MNDLDLHGMDAAHAFEAQGASGCSPALETCRVGNIAEYGVDRLYPRCMGGVNHTLSGIERLVACSRLRYAEVSRVVFEANGKGGDAVGGRCDGEGILDAKSRLQNRHQPDGSRHAGVLSDPCDRITY